MGYFIFSMKIFNELKNELKISRRVSLYTAIGVFTVVGIFLSKSGFFK